jgi:kynurenine formamidase
VDELYSLARHDQMDGTAFTMCSHFGTHLETPLHYLGSSAVGVGGYSIGPPDPHLGIPVHRIFLSGAPHRAAFEALDLSEVARGSYDAVALPIVLAGLEAAPTRAPVRAASS